MHNEYLFTSESVSAGHPDKICDQVADAILDECLRLEKQSRVAIEVMATHKALIIGGELTIPGYSSDKINIERIAIQVIKDIGYLNSQFGWEKFDILNFINTQSDDIATGVGTSEPKGAGDQGIMFGYACDETSLFLPATFYYVNLLQKKIEEIRREYENPFLGPDAKSQLTLKYKNNLPVGISSILVSSQHLPSISIKQIESVMQRAINEVFPKKWLDDDFDLYINPTGRFVIGGPVSDTGLTGRKLVVDSYGGLSPIGGGAFSGKDPSKTDRSAAYMTRYLAKNLVAAGVAKQCIIQISYAIGLAQPLSIFIDFKGTSKLKESTVINYIYNNFDLSPLGIINTLNLQRPIYLKSASYGHFGRIPTDEGHFSWERLDIIDKFKADLL